MTVNEQGDDSLNLRIENVGVAIMKSRLMPQSFAAWMDGNLIETMLPHAKPPKVAQSTG